MDKIASPNELAAELRRLLAYAGSEKPSRERIASELRGLAERVAGRLDAQKIKEALAYVHHWEKKKGRVEAAKEAIKAAGLNDDEVEVLLRSIHVKPSEIR